MSETTVLTAWACEKLCYAKPALLHIMESREMFILPLHLPCDECGSIATFKGTVNLLYRIVQIRCISDQGNFEVIALLLAFPPCSLKRMLAYYLLFKFSIISGVIQIQD